MKRYATRERKGQLWALISALHCLRIAKKFMGPILGVTPQRVGQIVDAMDLEPPEFDCLADVATWLAQHHPGLEQECRNFRDEIASQADEPKAA